MLNRSQKKILIGVVLALVAVVLLWMAPRTTEAPAPAAASPLDQKVEQAVALIQSGTSNPMEAITLLREVIAEDPNHRGANLWLGEFSMMSGQIDKAVSRFRHVLKIDPAYSPAAEKLVLAYLQLGQHDSAHFVVEQFEKNNPQAEGLDQLKAVLTEADSNHTH